MEVIKLAAASGCMIIGIFMLISAAVGVNRFRYATSRIHGAALGDTMGLFFCLLGLIIWRGPSFVSLKLFAILLFFWLTSPVAGHMICRMDLEVNEQQKDFRYEHREDEE